MSSMPARAAILMMAAIVAAPGAAVPAWAKGETVRLTVSGPGLAAYDVTSPGALVPNVWQGDFIKAGARPLPEPAAALPRYLVQFHVQPPRGPVQMMYAVRFVSDDASGRTMVHLPGRGDRWYGVNVRTILREGQDGRWFDADVAWGHALRASLPPAQSTRAGGTNGAAWAVPRTPWGDPDLQGTFTNKYEQSTPMERPKEFAGRRVEDIKGDELTRVLQERQRISDERAPFLAGDPTGQIRGNQAFSDRGEITKGSRAWMVVDPPDGQIPPMTAEAQKRIAARAGARGGRRASSFTNGPFDSYEDLSLYDRCITRGLPGSMLPAIYGDSYQIVQAPGYVAIRYEMIHETRVIPLDATPQPGAGVRLDMGSARGHWEGDTLVVETTNFHDRSIYRNGNPESMRLVERFTRTSPNTVEWAVTVDDPKTWTKPWTFALPLTLNDDEPVIEYACHEGNYAMRNMLSASRATERAAEAAKGR